MIAVGSGSNSNSGSNSGHCFKGCRNNRPGVSPASTEASLLFCQRVRKNKRESICGNLESVEGLLGGNLNPEGLCGRRYSVEWIREVGLARLEVASPSVLS